METGILHSHHLLVVLYIIFIAISFIVVLSKKRNAILALKARTRILRVVIEILMLGTGIFLMWKSPVGFANYILVKVGVMALGIVFFIIGTRKVNALWMFLSLLMFVYVYLVSRTRDVFLKPEEMRVHEAYLSATPENKGKAIYEVACLRCHGQDGKAQYRKSKNLATTVFKADAIATFVKMGKGVMPSYSYMKDEELSELVKYVESLKEKKE
jgi:cytochrome c553